MFKRNARLISRLFGAIILLAISGAAFYFGRRPFRSDLTIQNVHPGIHYTRSTAQRPYLSVYHLLEVDLTTSGLTFVSTSPQTGPHYAAQTVQAFAETHGTDLAINANFFYPFESNNPFDFYPHAGDLVELSGLAMNNGVVHSAPRQTWPALCISAEPRAHISGSGRCPAGTRIALAGNLQTVVDGRMAELPDEKVYPRTVIGVNETGDRLWILIVDGKQPFYSEGATYFFCAQRLREAGAADVLNLDGGGSTTLVINQDGDQQVFNAPYHTRVVMRQRPVANHLGILVQR